MGDAPFFTKITGSYKMCSHKLARDGTTSNVFKSLPIMEPVAKISKHPISNLYSSPDPTKTKTKPTLKPPAINQK